MNKENILMSDVPADSSDLKNNESPSPSGVTSSPLRKPLASYINNFESPNNLGEPVIVSKKLPTSGKVIESLQCEIDYLKSEIISLKESNYELKKSNEVVKNRRDALMEQLSNSKHEVDTVNSLLQRKQRRVTDLENELNEVSNSSDDMKFKFKSLEVKFENLLNKETFATTEYKRIKAAYETIVSSQKDYREFYTKEIKVLKKRLADYVEEGKSQIAKNISMINKSDATVYRSIKSITIRSRELEEKYSKKEENYTELIRSLSSKVLKSERDVEALLKFSKELFDEIAQKAQIDKREFLEKYLENSGKEDPFAKAEALLLEYDKHNLSELESEQPLLSLSDDSKKLSPVSALTFAKRQNKKTKPASKQTVGERMIYLGKELNKAVRSVDRTTVVEPIVRPKSVKKKSYLRRSRQFEDKSTPKSSGFNSRRSSRSIEVSVPQDLERRVLPAGSPSSSHSRRASHYQNDFALYAGDENEGAQFKKKGRRRKHNSRKASDEDHSDYGEAGSDTEHKQN